MPENTDYQYDKGGFYVTDDNNSLIHQYYTLRKGSEEDITVAADVVTPDESKTVQRHVTAVASTSKIEVGETVLTVANAFGMLRHHEHNKKCFLFIIELQMKIESAQAGSLYERQTHPFKVRVRGINNEKLSHHAWDLFTVTTAYDPDAKVEELPTVTTSIVAPKYGDNTGYKFRDERTTMYAYDPTADITYTLAVLNIETVENSYHTEPAEDDA